MAEFYQSLEVVRTTNPDMYSLFTTLRNADPTVGIYRIPGTNTYTLKKSTAWTQPQINGAANAIANAPAITPQLTAQEEIDKMKIFYKALILALVDEINILRQAAGMQPRTPAQAIQAIRNKAGTL